MAGRAWKQWSRYYAVDAASLAAIRVMHGAWKLVEELLVRRDTMTGNLVACVVAMVLFQRLVDKH